MADEYELRWELQGGFQGMLRTEGGRAPVLWIIGRLVEYDSMDGEQNVLVPVSSP